jgi:hypothetical protein
MKNKYLFFAFFLLTTTIMLAQDPSVNTLDGVKVWFDTHLNEQGELVWRDKTGNTKPVFANTTHQPTKMEALNFNPCFYFDGVGNDIDIPLGQMDLSQSSFFIVYQSADSNVTTTVWDFEKDKVSKMLLITHFMAHFDPNEYIQFIEQPKAVAQINGYIHYKPQEETEPLSQNLHIGGNPMKPNSPAPFKGKIAEILVFDKVVNYDEFLRIESYLALKYGISVQHSYYNSKGDIVWDMQKNVGYAANITGIGRDEASHLYQKQATSSNKPQLLTIGLEQIADSNLKNKANFEDNSFLIWSDNNQDLYFEKKEAQTYKPLNRKWLMTSSGQTASLQTVLKFDTKQIRSVVPKGEPYFLMIDRSGKGIFNAQSDIIKADSSDEKGFVFFKNIRWDTEGSGSDVFSIATAADIAPIIGQIGNFKSVSLYPNPTSDGVFTLRADLLKQGDMGIKIHDVLGQLISSQILRGNDFYIYNEKLNTKGIYIITLTSDKTTQTFKIIAH